MVNIIKTKQDLMETLGAQIRKFRIDQGLDQIELARRANISVGAVQNLECGRGSSLSSLIQVVRAFGRESWLENFYVLPTISPLAMLRDKKLDAPRQRVKKSRRKKRLYLVR